MKQRCVDKRKELEDTKMVSLVGLSNHDASRYIDNRKFHENLLKSYEDNLLFMAQKDFVQDILNERGELRRSIVMFEAPVGAMGLLMGVMGFIPKKKKEEENEKR